ncbi:MAG: hypothetical protein DRG33_01540 [Deltaproteobacteria bacterium]|nr:MAG: hypothetical protein DRG33_01540 [Deltaproteobacteria bacterium]
MAEDWKIRTRLLTRMSVPIKYAGQTCWLTGEAEVEVRDGSVEPKMVKDMLEEGIGVRMEPDGEYSNGVLRAKFFWLTKEEGGHEMTDGKE